MGTEDEFELNEFIKTLNLTHDEVMVFGEEGLKKFDYFVAPIESDEEEEEEEDWCDDHEQSMWKNGLKCGGCLELEEEQLTHFLKCNRVEDG